MSNRYNRVITGDCIRGMRTLADEVVDLAFADPPFNIGYEYDEYNDKRAYDEYLRWSHEWVSEVKRILKPDGAFWLAIGDEYAAELKVLATRKLGFFCRSWVVWYYTFGVHCNSKFTRSHTHLFHFVKNPDKSTFNDPAIRVPSARQLVYADKRANPNGRVPDDTWIIRPTPHESWILRPQDLPEGFVADSDTWYFPRVCGTFKERMGFHGCQMPEQLLGRIIRACSNEGDLVLDPFVGSGTTLAVAKKLGRSYLGFDTSQDYVAQSKKRLQRINQADPLDGVENPLVSVASTLAGRKRRSRAGESKRETPRTTGSLRAQGSHSPLNGNARTTDRRIGGLRGDERAIVEAFEETSEGYSSDRVVADPELNRAFLANLRRKGIRGSEKDWNRSLLNLRKANRLHLGRPTKRTKLDAKVLDRCEIASEYALAKMQRQTSLTLDSLLSDPIVVREFDELAAQIISGIDVLYCRWAALRIRKDRKKWCSYGSQLADVFRLTRFSRAQPFAAISLAKVPPVAGLFHLQVPSQSLYVGQTSNLREWTEYALDACRFPGIDNSSSDEPRMGYCPLDTEMLGLTASNVRRGAKCLLIGKRNPLWSPKVLAA